MLLHISNNFFGSAVHGELIKSIQNKISSTKKQIVFCPMRKDFKENFEFKNSDNVIVEKYKFLNSWIRYFPFIKLLYVFIFFLLSMKNRKEKVEFVVAHNLWSDGAIAFFYYCLTKTPYSVAVRSSDVKYFLPKLPHYRWLIKLIVKKSEKCVFINRSYLKECRTSYPKIFSSPYKQVVIYNGINSYWHNNALKNDKAVDAETRPLNVIYVGSFIVRKNLPRVFEAVRKCRDDLPVGLTVIGGKKEDFLYKVGIREVPEWVSIIPHTTDKDVIKKELRKSRVFVMPSWNETFGLVYLEALSQGCSVIHSRGEGVDGLIEEPFFKPVSPYDVDEIKMAILELVDKYPGGVSRSKISEILPSFEWDNIAFHYIDFISPYLD